MFDLRIFIFSLGIYLLLTGNLQLSNWLVGGLLAGAITLLLPNRTVLPGWRRLPRILWAIVQYVFVLLYDLVKSGLEVAWIVIHPRLPIHPGVVKIHTNTENEWANALSAHAITITPGTLALEMDDHGVIYAHCLDARSASRQIEELHGLRENLLKKIQE